MLDLDETKLHLRVEHDDEDDLIEGLMATAAASVGEYLGLTPAELVPCPPPVKSAAMLLIGDLYANREAQSERQLHRNAAYERLLAPYRLMRT